MTPVMIDFFLVSGFCVLSILAMAVAPGGCRGEECGHIGRRDIDTSINDYPEKR